MQKGKYLESQIDKVIQAAEKLGYHGHKNHPQRLFNGEYIGGEPYDYDLFLPGYHAAFDAKECLYDKWQIRSKDIKQAYNLLRCQNAGLDAFFLILFEGKKLKKIPVSVVVDRLQSGKKTIYESDGEEWDIAGRINALAETRRGGQDET